MLGSYPGILSSHLKSLFKAELYKASTPPLETSMSKDCILKADSGNPALSIDEKGQACLTCNYSTETQPRAV